MNDLASKQCVPCRGGVPPLKGAELQAFLRDVNNGWQVIDEHHLEKEYHFKWVSAVRRAPLRLRME